MYKTISTLSVLAVCLASLAGCNEKVENKTVTHYSSDMCSVDLIAGKTNATAYVQRGTVNFAGWAVDTSKQIAPERLRLRLTGLEGKPHVFGDPAIVDRPDIVTAFHNEKLLKSGFSFEADLSALAPGGYGIILEIPDGNSLLVCQPKKVLVIQ